MGSLSQGVWKISWMPNPWPMRWFTCVIKLRQAPRRSNSLTPDGWFSQVDVKIPTFGQIASSWATGEGLKVGDPWNYFYWKISQSNIVKWSNLWKIYFPSSIYPSLEIIHLEEHSRPSRLGARVPVHSSSWSRCPSTCVRGAKAIWPKDPKYIFGFIQMDCHVQSWKNLEYMI